jgi:predicted DNA-binding ribbon-helix-helix protein
MHQTTIYIDDGIKEWLSKRPRDFNFSELVRLLVKEYIKEKDEHVKN